MRIPRGVLAVAYPFLLFAGLQGLEPRSVGAILAGLWLLRLIASGQRLALLRPLLAPSLCVAAVLVPTLVWNDPVALLFVPALVNLGLLFAFGRTLQSGPSMIERFARLQEDELSAEQIAHCRAFTIVWCAFFIVNIAVCLVLAIRGELPAWTLYTGLVSYLLMGGLFLVEWVVRAWRFRNYQGSIAEPLFRRWFPTEPSA